MLEINLEKNYSEKMQPLFELGEESLGREYDATIYQEFDFEQEDIEELITLVLDYRYESLDYAKYPIEYDRFYNARIHAQYILAELKATQAIFPVLVFMDIKKEKSDFDYQCTVLFLTIFGEKGLDTLEAYMFRNPNSTMLITILEAFEAMLEQEDPSISDRIEEILVGYIQNDVTQEAVLAFSLCTLAEITKDKHIDLIREAFKSKEVDVMWCGDIEDIEIKLGLRKKRETPRPKNKFQKMFEMYGIKSPEDFKKLFEEKRKCGRTRYPLFHATSTQRTQSRQKRSLSVWQWKEV